MLSLVTPKGPDLELVPVSWLFAFQRGRFDVQTGQEDPPPREAPPLEPKSQPQIGRARPQCSDVLTAKIHAAMPDEWTDAKHLAARVKTHKSTVQAALRIMAADGRVSIIRPGPGTNQNVPWLFRRA